MPSEYVSGNARQTLPRAVRWSLAMLLRSPPTYCAGVRTPGKIRETTKSLSFSSSIVPVLRGVGDCGPGAEPPPPIRHVLKPSGIPEPPAGSPASILTDRHRHVDGPRGPRVGD